MNIAIRSEADSRMLVYPLIRALYNYGSICVVTNNVYMNRLIDTDTMEGGFRNVRVIVCTNNDLEDIIEEERLNAELYEYVIYDNVGFQDFDIECVIITSRVSESYLQEVIWMVGEEGTVIFRFGEGIKPPKEKKEKKEPTNKKRRGKGKGAEEQEVEIDAIEDVGDMSKEVILDGAKAQAKDTGFNEDGTIKNKWTMEKTDAEILNEKLAEAQAAVLPFPSFKDIEDMESRWILPKVNGKLAKILYNMLKDEISVDERQFMKGVSSQDEGGNFISGADVR